MGGGPEPGADRPTFVIQEHHARALHWDFRLEHDGVLVSWALPKGLPLDPGRNHLAVHTEDHPLAYGSFEGDIPAGEYGGGRVSLWDRGHFELEKWRDDEVMVVLHGARAEGRYVLFPTKGRNWMIHRMDPAPAGFAPLPTSVKPMLAVAGALPADDRGWAYEIKWDGIRAIVFVEGGRIRVQSRNGRDITGQFPELHGLGASLGARSAVLDGEIVSLGEDGRPDFNRLQHRLQLAKPGEIRRRSADEPANLVIFDVLYLDGASLLGETYDARRDRLESLHLAGPGFATADSFRDRPGRDVLQATAEVGLEGVVAKRRDSHYRPGRREPQWVKVKNVRTQEVVVGGWTEGQGERSGSLGALLLGIPEGKGLRYVGKVGTGFSAADRRALLQRFQPLAARTSPFTTTLARREVTAPVHFLRPEVVGEVRYSEWTPDGRLRHPTWRGLRTDKGWTEVVAEPVGTEGDDAARHPPGSGVPVPDHPAAGVEPRTRGREVAMPTAKVRVSVGDRQLEVSNLDKVLFPATGFTKGQLIDYYLKVAPTMLPHLRDRPVTLKRYPDGVDGKSFFEKHVPSHAPDWVPTVTVPTADGGDPVTYAVIGDLPTLAWAANLATVEFHVPLWRAGRRRKLPSPPDFMVFDLDPGEGTTIVECCRVAVLVAEVLADRGAEAFYKTSGSKGLQVYTALRSPRGPSWDDLRTDAHDIALALEADHPELVVSNMRKTLRRGRVLIDWSQNHPAKTTVAVYSVRGRSEPTVSTPVSEQEVRTCAAEATPDSLRFTTDQVLRRIDRDGDLFAPLGR
jgi:bifunctional non-homologous end joining protein LigD